MSTGTVLTTRLNATIAAGGPKTTNEAVEGIADLVELLARRVAAQARRIAQLEQANGELRSRDATQSNQIFQLQNELSERLVYRRIWREDASYRRNEVTTYKGQLWICESATNGDKPGTTNGWRLMFKKENL